MNLKDLIEAVNKGLPTSEWTRPAPEANAVSKVVSMAAWLASKKHDAHLGGKAE